ncbi:MAG: hypothetical protein IJS84_08495 [Spirochaetales bacterium]|nr:hypothetical protein [Spirochaetales bacterium]
MKKKLLSFAFYVAIVAMLFVLVLMVSCKKQENGASAAPTVAEEPKVDYGPSIPPTKTAKVTWAGCRRSDYGWKEAMFKREPSAEEWVNYAGRMGAEYEGSIPSFIWIVGSITGNEGAQRCSVNFPVGQKIEGVEDFPADMNKAFLDMCDEKGYSVWLQVEPGDCDLVPLAKATMEYYKDHKCVKGFGVDVEWYKTRNPEMPAGYGTKIDDDLAKALDEAVKSVDPRFTLFLKHWDGGWMPPTYRSDIIFVNDSQYFDNLDKMKSFFTAWADRYYPNPVMFQIGYPADFDVWGKLENPKGELGAILAEDVKDDQHVGIIWVDFSLRKAMQSGK